MSGKERRLRLSSRAAALTKECDLGANPFVHGQLCSVQPLFPSLPLPDEFQTLVKSVFPIFLHFLHVQCVPPPVIYQAPRGSALLTAPRLPAESLLGKQPKQPGFISVV